MFIDVLVMTKILLKILLKDLIDNEKCCFELVTTGGTGPAFKRCYSEATEAICDRMMPGFGELMRSVSYNMFQLQFFKTDSWSARTSLIVNLPGNQNQ